VYREGGSCILQDHKIRRAQPCPQLFIQAVTCLCAGPRHLPGHKFADFSYKQPPPKKENLVDWQWLSSYTGKSCCPATLGQNCTKLHDVMYIRVRTIPRLHVSGNTKFCMLAKIWGFFGIEHASCQLSRACNFEVASRFLESLWKPWLHQWCRNYVSCCQVLVVLLCLRRLQFFVRHCKPFKLKVWLQSAEKIFDVFLCPTPPPRTYRSFVIQTVLITLVSTEGGEKMSVFFLSGSASSVSTHKTT
jgi:hypothetical protein